MRYCRQCGERLTQTRRLIGYNGWDGAARYRYQRSCPKHRWWNSHTKVWTIAEDDTLADGTHPMNWLETFA